MDNSKPQRATVLLVDDEPDNIDVLKNILKAKYRIVAATSGVQALKIAESTNPPDMILLDIMMPEMDGYEVCRKLKSSYRTAQIPVIFVTAKGDIEDESHGFDLGAVDYIHKPVSPSIVRRRVKTQLSLYDQQRLLEDRVEERTRELENSRLEIILQLGRAAEYKDNETGQHVKRMSAFSYILGRAAGLSESEADLLLKASPMHDIGKIGIPDRVLLKPGKLDAVEWEIMQTHSQIGADILGDYDSILINMAREIALTHHEKWDGSGYPNGLAGEEIPLVGRIVAIADVFDALTSTRPYKKAWKVEDAVDLIISNTGSHFDPELTPLFVDKLPEILEVRERYKEE